MISLEFNIASTYENKRSIMCNKKHTNKSLNYFKPTIYRYDSPFE